MVPRTGLDGCRKSSPHRDSIPGPSRQYRVAIPTELSRPFLIKVSDITFHRSPSSVSHADTCGRRDMTKLMGAFATTLMRSKRIFIFIASRPALLASLASYSMATGEGLFSQEDTGRRSEAYHLPNAKVKNAWTLTSIPMTRCLIKYTANCIVTVSFP